MTQGARALARALIGEPEQADLFDDGTRDQTMGVRLKGVRVENSRKFGDVYLALALWPACRLDEFALAHLPVGKEEVAWEKIAAVLVAARLCEPSSELHIAEDGYRRTVSSDLLQLDEALVNKDRLYRALDQLLPHKAALEAHLSRRVGELFAIDNEVLLYEVTSTYFEGEAAGNAQAQRGYSRDHRPDGKQVCIALTRLNRAAINRQIGRLLQRNQRAAARFAIDLKDADTPAGCLLEVSIREDFDQWAALSEGAYVLRSNITDWSDDKLWKAYIQLTQAEAAFRIQKDQRAMRPIWHQREDRVQAHILVCFLAFVLWKTLELWQERAGLGNSPRTWLEELARIQAHDVILPTATHGDIRLRCITQPDAAQTALLDRLGIVLPKRNSAAGDRLGSNRTRRGLKRAKCSADFLDKSLISHHPTNDSAQVGLALTQRSAVSSNGQRST